jgi:hypothetical protein
VLAVISIRTMARTDAPASGLVINAGTSLTPAPVLNLADESLAPGNGDQGSDGENVGGTVDVAALLAIARRPGSPNSRLTERSGATPVDELSPTPPK